VWPVAQGTPTQISPEGHPASVVQLVWTQVSKLMQWRCWLAGSQGTAAVPAQSGPVQFPQDMSPKGPQVMPHVPQKALQLTPPLAQVGPGVVVVVDVVVVEVVVSGATGAQNSFGVLGVTGRLPNGSFSWSVGKVAFRHLIL